MWIRRRQAGTGLSFRGELSALLIALAVQAATSPAVGAQGVHERTPNLSGGWTGTPGTLQLHFDHRFWVLNERVFNSPTFLVAVPLSGDLLVGGHYASNSRVAQASTNEWEVWGRWAPDLDWGRVEPGLTAGYNVHTGSVDAELSVAVALAELRLLAAGRGFTDLGGGGDTGWFVGGGVVVPVRSWLFAAADLGRVDRGDSSSGRIWGAALQIRIPTTPHTLSLRAGNTRTGTLQGSSLPGRTNWGFEFTVPFTLSRYFGLATSP